MLLSFFPLSFSISQICKIKEHNGNVHVSGLKEVQARTLEEAKQVLRYGARHRVVSMLLFVSRPPWVGQRQAHVKCGC